MNYGHYSLLISVACQPAEAESLYIRWCAKQSKSQDKELGYFAALMESLEENAMIAPIPETRKYGITSYGARFASSLASDPDKQRGGRLWAGQPVEFRSNMVDQEANAWIVSLRLASKSSSVTKGGTRQTPAIRATGLEEWSVPASSKEPSTG